MSPWVAVVVVSWIAIVVLYLGLAACLREIRLLRGQVSRLSYPTAAAPSRGAAGAGAGEGLVEDVVELDTPVPGRAGTGIALTEELTGGHHSVVLASDSACPLCRLVLARLADLSPRLPEPAVLLTYESDEAWGPLPAGIRVVRDDPSWSAVAHLTPPVLMLVAPSGEVLELALPAGPDDVDHTLESFRTFYSRR